MTDHNIDATIKLLRALATGSDFKESHLDIIFVSAADLIETQHKALSVALKMLAPNEPGDSRAVSNEFVAIASVQYGFIGKKVTDVLDGALKDD